MSEAPEDQHEFPIQPGDSIGPYVVESFLARGGMGVLLRGLDTMLDRPVAIKVIDPRFADTGDFAARFERECKILAKLRHPNIVTIYYFSEWKGAPFFAMELVEGSNLDDRVKRGERVAWRQAVIWMMECCGALEAAREAGVIHRDLKPANILLDDTGGIRIVDFGLAKSMASSKHLTAAAMVVGTPHYMSPEQAKGLELDWRSDLYSLGATFFHVLTGQTLFDAPRAMEVVSKHICETPQSLASFRQGYPDALIHLIDQLLQKDPSARGFAGYPQVIEALQSLLDAPVQVSAQTMVQAVGARNLGSSSLGAQAGATQVSSPPVSEAVLARSETVVAASNSELLALQTPAEPAYGWLEVDPKDAALGLIDVALAMDGFVSFGTHHSNPICLPFHRRSAGAKLIAGRGGHGAFVWTPGGWRLRPLRHRKTKLLNECRMAKGPLLSDGDHPVQPGDEIDLRNQVSLFLGGSFEGGLRVSFAVHDEDTRSSSDYQEWHTVLFQNRVIVGGKPTSGIYIAAPVPEELLWISVSDGRFWVEPRSSGCTLKKAPLTQLSPLDDGDEIAGPGFRYRFRFVDGSLGLHG